MGGDPRSGLAYGADSDDRSEKLELSRELHGPGAAEGRQPSHAPPISASALAHADDVLAAFLARAACGRQRTARRILPHCAHTEGRPSMHARGHHGLPDLEHLHRQRRGRWPRWSRAMRATFGVSPGSRGWRGDGVGCPPALPRPAPAPEAACRVLHVTHVQAPCRGRCGVARPWQRATPTVSMAPNALVTVVACIGAPAMRRRPRRSPAAAGAGSEGIGAAPRAPSA